MKTMYALTYIYEGVEDSMPYAVTLAVSDSRDKLEDYMNECVEDDCRKPDNEDEEWETDHNFSEVYRHYDGVRLQHRAYTELYAGYEIRKVDVL